MIYKADPGYIVVKVCGTFLLVAKREKWEQNPVVRPIPKKHAACLAMMARGKTSDQMLRSISTILKRPYGTVEKSFSRVFSDLSKDGYLIPLEEHNE